KNATTHPMLGPNRGRSDVVLKVQASSKMGKTSSEMERRMAENRACATLRSPVNTARWNTRRLQGLSHAWISRGASLGGYADDGPGHGARARERGPVSGVRAPRERGLSGARVRAVTAARQRRLAGDHAPGTELP